METVTQEESERRHMASFIKSGRDLNFVSRFPPTRIFLYPDIFEAAWGWDRLLPKDQSPMPLYLDYLKEYHRRNVMDYVAAAAADGTSRPEEWPLKARPVEDVTTKWKCSPKDGKDALTAAARFCLDMELHFMSEWKDGPIRNVRRLSQKIQERASFIICVGREFSEPAAASLVCIANEAALASELLRCGAKHTDEEIVVCNCIRQCALSLMYMKGPNSDASTAAMVGFAKEARKMCEWMRKENRRFVYYSHMLYSEMGLCDKIRVATFDVVKYIVSNYTGKSYVLMGFREKNKSKSKSQKTSSATSNKHFSQDQLDESKKEHS